MILVLQIALGIIGAVGVITLVTSEIFGEVLKWIAFIAAMAVCLGVGAAM